jgi:DNA-binding transcriptional MerR regulator
LKLVTTYKLEDLAREAGVAARTVRYYVQRGLLPAPAFRGRDTTYDDGHLVRLRAIKRLQEAHLPLDEIQARLEGASPAELERLAGGPAPLPVDRDGCVPPGRTGEPDGSHPYRSPPRRHEPAPVDETWRRIELVPGVELFVRTDAGAEARRVAREIESQYRAGSR